MSLPTPIPPRAAASLTCTDPRERFVVAREALRVAMAVGFDRRAALEISMAAAELASNAVVHGSGGTIALVALSSPRLGIEIVCSDDGPGFVDANAAIADGYSKGKMLGPEDRRSERLGCGLGAVSRAMDELSIHSRPGEPTVVRAVRYLVAVGRRRSLT